MCVFLYNFEGPCHGDELFTTFVVASDLAAPPPGTDVFKVSQMMLKTMTDFAQSDGYKKIHQKIFEMEYCKRVKNVFYL